MTANQYLILSVASYIVICIVASYWIIGATRNRRRAGDRPHPRNHMVANQSPTAWNKPDIFDRIAEDIDYQGERPGLEIKNWFRTIDARKLGVSYEEIGLALWPDDPDPEARAKVEHQKGIECEKKLREGVRATAKHLKGRSKNKEDLN